MLYFDIPETINDIRKVSVYRFRKIPLTNPRSCAILTKISPEDRVVSLLLTCKLYNNNVLDANTKNWYPGGLVPLREILG